MVNQFLLYFILCNNVPSLLIWMMAWSVLLVRLQTWLGGMITIPEVQEGLRQAGEIGWQKTHEVPQRQVQSLALGIE